jgi:hypothetical protein
LGLQRIILEGDSLQVVNTLKAEGLNWSISGQIVEDAKGVLRTFLSWQVYQTKREGNSSAHGLAKEAVHRVIDRVWIDSIPESIRDIVLSE